MISVLISRNETPVQIGHFTDGTLKMNCPIPNDVGVATIRWCYESEEELVALIHTVHHLREHGIPTLHLDMPYIPNARQDRVQLDGEVFTLKSFAKVINWLNFSSVTVLDAHSRVSEALLDRVVNIMPHTAIREAIMRIKWDLGHENVVTFYPDEGAMKRYASSHHYPTAFGMKTRNPETGKVDSLKIAGDTQSIAGSTVLIVDDICARGDTAYRSAKALREAGAEHVYLFVTHCENTIFSSMIVEDDIIEKVFTTKSIYTGNNPKIEILPN